MQSCLFSVEWLRQIEKEASAKNLILQVLCVKFKIHKEKKNA